MIRRLLELDKNNINETTARKIKKYLEMPKFTPEEVGLLILNNNNKYEHNEEIPYFFDDGRYLALSY